MVRNLHLTMEYDGSAFHGWQRQPNCETVQGTLERALSKLMGQKVLVQGTSRTDAGVHALGQCASFAGEFGIPTERILFPLNNMLPGTIRIKGIVERPTEFHARHDAVGKTYRYRIKNTQDQSVFDRNYVFYMEKPLDMAAMEEGAAWMVGTHDFKSFQASGGEEKPTTVRRISGLSLSQTGDEIRIEVTGNGFLYNMVRIMAGTLMETGLGRIPPGDIPRIIQAKDRSRAGFTAPPQGLYLMQVHYGPLYQV